MTFLSKSTEYAHEIRIHEQREILKQHFNLYYRILSDSKLIPEANFMKIDSIYRSLSGIPLSFHNAILGCPKPDDRWDDVIAKQISYFKK